MTDKPGILLRVEMVRLRMRSWGLSAGDEDYIDTTNPASLEPADPRYVRADHPGLPAYHDRIRAEGNDPNGRPDDIDQLRRRAGLL